MHRLTLVTSLVAAAIGMAAPAHAAAPAPAHGFGLHPVARTHAQLPQRPRLAAAPLPAAVDLTPWAVPVGNQGALSSCVTWAIDYAMLGWYSHREGHEGQPFAPMYAYSQIQAAHGWQDGGAYVDDAFGVAEQQGVDTEADYPQGSYDWQTLPTPAQHANAAAHKTLGHSYLFATWPQAPGDGARSAIEAALSTGHPVAMSIAVYQPFEQLNLSSHLMTAASVGSSKLLGYHEVLALGYDATGVRIQNSWGTGWGDRGFADLGWDFVEQYTLDASMMTGFTDSTTDLPAVASVSPATGATGTSVVIHGLDLGGASSVMFGDAAASFSVVDDSTVIATAPVATGAVHVRVTSMAGTSTTADADLFSYASPRTTALSTTAGPTSGGTVLTLRGSMLSQISGVQVGGRAATVLSHDATTVRVVTPAHPAGAVAVTLSPGNLAAGSFRYVAAPAVKRIARISARVLALQGRNLGSTKAVTIGGHKASIIYAGARYLRVHVRPGHGTVRIRVVTAYGTWSGTYRYR